MKQVCVSSRAEWRAWLADNHDKEKSGIWLVFFETTAGRPSLDYEASVEEALCFGWIDSIIKRIDERRYCRKFTPRKNDSNWSETNRRRTKKIIKEGRMTEAGLAKIKAAKTSGRWERNSRPVVHCDMPSPLSEELARNAKARKFFEKLAPTYRKHFIAWIVTAKREETQRRRVQEAIALLSRSQKLGLK